MAVAIDLDDAYNRVQFKLLMDLLAQYGVSLTLTRWITGAHLERTVVMKLEHWTSATHQLTLGLPQDSPLSPVLYKVYKKGLAERNQNVFSRVLTLVDDGRRMFCCIKCIAFWLICQIDGEIITSLACVDLIVTETLTDFNQLIS